MEELAPDREPPGSTPTAPRKRRWVLLKVGCLALVVPVCVTAGLVAAALRSGPVELKFPGGTVLGLGSEDFVLSNYSFQNGDTYFLDLNGNGVRHILELHYLEESRTLELVLNYANKERQGEQPIWRSSLP